LVLSQRVTALALKWSLHRVQAFIKSILFSSSAAEVRIVSDVVAVGEKVAVGLCLLQNRLLQPSQKSPCEGHLHRR